MSRFCQNVEASKTIDSKLLKPIISILSRLHERKELGLGDVLLRREALIHEIRKHLLMIQKGPLRAPIGAAIAELDAELRKIEISKVNHPAAWSVGKLDNLKERIFPDESSSVRMRTTNRELEGTVSHRSSASKDVSRNEPEQDMLIDDVDPHPEIIEWSTRVVEEWLAKNGDVLLSEDASED
ncbi:hypothetical protein NHQ30_006071 [Ciborinia camelliae]|nr:hypothetical protein NHQ30_006071 [Ciborinia camelliae]